MRRQFFVCSICRQPGGGTNQTFVFDPAFISEDEARRLASTAIPSEKRKEPTDVPAPAGPAHEQGQLVGHPCSLFYPKRRVNAIGENNLLYEVR